MTKSPEELEREKQIELGCKLPGATGAFWRLMKVMDADKVRAWLQSERMVHGTPPIQVADVIGDIVGLLTYYAACTVGRTQMRALGQDIFKSGVAAFEHSIAQEIDRKKSLVPVQLVK